MKHLMTRPLGAALTAALLASGAQVMAATPASGTLSDDNAALSWKGVTVGSNPNSCAGAADPACDYFELVIEPITVSGGASYHVTIEMDSAGNMAGSDDWDMYIYDANGAEVDHSASGGSAERVLLINPQPGIYTVEHQAWLVLSAPQSYRASASYEIVQPEDGPPLAVAADDGESIFATPTLMDSQLHTGEPSIAVSPVVPANGSRPLIVGDAPWGTSNATSLWWRSRDGGESFELVQDPMAAPRPRPCEEIDGGGDSDTTIDRHGNIYVNDLAALINITVGASQDDFQTMSCSKVGGTNPLQPIQDRQWVVASPLADGPDGPGIDAFITFRRGLINGTPATETAIQIYSTTDGGASYQPTGEITDPDFFGYDNTKVSQTGNPVVSSDGTLWQSYYNGTIAKVAHYDPADGSFTVHVVAERPADVGNVFPTLAIDSADNLYYAWIEGGTFDVLFSASTDAGASWSAPVRVNAPGDSELAVNPYMVAGSEGRVAVLFNATRNATSPDGADGMDWNLYLSQSVNAHTASPAFTQYKVTDTPLHFNAICTGGLGCTLSGGDRSLLEFNEVDIDPLDGSMVFIFADNGRRPQPPLVEGDIPQPYIMFTRQIAGESMIAGKKVQNTLPRTNYAQDREGDSTYPKAGTAEGPKYPVMDILFSRLEATDTGVRAYMSMKDLSDPSDALGIGFGDGDPRLTDRAIWVTRFEVNEKVYALGMDFKRGSLLTGPVFWYGTPGVARNSGIKRSSYGYDADHTEIADVGLIDGDTLVVEIPYAYMGIDPDIAEKPVFHSVVSFALAQPDGSLDAALELPEEVAEFPDSSYFNNQRTVDASKAYDWTLGDKARLPPNEDEDSDDDDYDDDGSRDDSDSDDDNDGRGDDSDSDDDNDGISDDSDSDDDNDGIRDEHDDKGKKEKQKKKYASAESNSADTHAMDVSTDTLLLFAIVEGVNAEALNVEIRNPAGALLASSVSTPGRAIATAVPLGTGIYTIKVSNPTGEAIAYELTLISRSNWL